MTAPYYVELLTPSGEVKSRYRFSQLPISIGRGYDNDLVLDDRYLAAQHAVVEMDEGRELVMRDAGSRNGLVHKGQRHTRVPLDAHKVVRLGHSNLRIRNAQFKVADEVPDNTAYGWEGWPPALCGALIVIMLSLASIWITDTEKFSAIRYLMASALVFAIVLVWCGAWSFANRVFASHPRFGRHLFVVACGLLLMDAWNVVSITIAYALSWEWLTSYSDHVMLLIAAGIVYFHLITIHPQSPRRFAVLCAVLSLIGSGLLLMNNYQRYGRLADDLYMSYILPPETRLSANQPVAEFIDHARVLKSRVDADRLKPVNKDMLLLGDDDEAATDADE